MSNDGKIEHGRSYAYFDLKCRCAICVAWRKKYRKREKDRLQKRIKNNDPSVKHGSYATYAAGCRCGACILIRDKKVEQKFESLKRRIATDPSSVKHGNIETYRAGCRCDDCLLNHHTYYREVGKKYQTESMKSATNFGKEWTSVELEVLDRYPLRKAAEILGRTYWAVHSKKRKIREKDPKVMFLLHGDQPDTRRSIVRRESDGDLSW